MSGISLALSGGGIRAMAFHMGVLRYLAENGLLEKVESVSSVSGGSLLIGLVLKESDMRWPDSEAFLRVMYPALERKLCSISLMRGMIRQLLRLKNYKYILYRANILSAAIREDWGITQMLGDLPETPEIAFEGTTAENGNRFRFKRDTFGDYELGYADSAAFPLADAMAVSAAFPGGIGAFELDTRKYRWWQAGVWEASGKKKETVSPYAVLHLYDGGVYDNLGLEPFFNAGTMQLKHGDTFLLVSDAGSPFYKGFSYTSLNPMRLKRVLDIVMEQCRSLRVRTLQGYLKKAHGNGAYIWINTAIDAEYEDMHKFAAGFPTTLCKLTPGDFMKIAGYGYQVARKRITPQDVARILE